MSAPRHSHEQSDLEPKSILYFAAALAVLIAVICAGVWWMFRELEGEEAGRLPGPAPADVPVRAASPQLQIDPQADLQKLRREEEMILSTYGWIDRERGIARIPVDRAMQIFLERQNK
jgi:hypothetical protein